MTSHKHYWALFMAVLLSLFDTVQAESQDQQELLFFLSGGPVFHQISSQDDVQDNDFNLEADIIYSYLKGDFRFFAEYDLSTDESELERFKLGWQLGDETTAWLGRFHSPARYWNSVYHHGHYLQTSITRPLIEKFEDEGGILPTHSTGVMLDTLHKLQNVDGFQTTISIGTAPVIGDHELIPYDLLDARSEHRAAAAIRFAYLPDLLGENQFGLLLNWSNLVVDDSLIAKQQDLQRVEQGNIGAYLDWRKQDWKLLANLTYVSNQLKKQVQNQSDTFFAGYFQAEYELSEDWKVFGRTENTVGEEDSEYFRLFPSAVTQREMLGLRFDFYRKHALTVEISKVKTLSEDFGQAWLQWSAALP